MSEERSGSAHLITGGMFSGKTDELIRRIRIRRVAHERVIIFKPDIDSRSGKGAIKSHVGETMKAFDVSASNPKRIIMEMLTRETHQGRFNVVGIDEAQFFSIQLVEVVNQLAESGREVIVAGLLSDYKGMPFETILSLVPHVEEVVRLLAVCNKCRGKNAIYTQLLEDVSPDESRIKLGDGDIYEARCRHCFEPK